MRWNRILRLAIALGVVALIIPPAVMAQSATTGLIEGLVVDQDGKPIAGAIVTAVAKRAPVTTTTDSDGRYLLPSLVPGVYNVRAEADGYTQVTQEGVQVKIDTRQTVNFFLSPGIVEEVTVTSEAPVVDTKTTTIGATFTVDQYTDYIPIGRNFSDSFQIAPGVVTGGGTGEGNYSISGSSGLENSYLVDGVNITNTGYGGIGSYNIIYGSLGTGVTTDFLEEIQIKTGAIDAEYGQATGGVVNTVVKSGTNSFSGAISAYFTPSGLYENFKETTLSTGAVNVVERERTDAGVNIGGPIVKDKAFFFAAYNPVKSTSSAAVQGLELPPAAGVPTFPAAALGAQEFERTSDNWAAKFTFYATPNHRIELSGFGDPSIGEFGPQNTAALRFLDYPAGGGQSEIEYGANNYSIRYDAVFSPRFFMEFQASRHDGDFSESPAVNKPRVRDRRQQLAFLFPLIYGDAFVGIDGSNGATWFDGGTGFVSNAKDKSDNYRIAGNWVIGNHEVKGGVEYADIEYTDDQSYSGDPIDYTIPLDGDGDGVYSDSTTPCDYASPIDYDCFVSLTSTSGAAIDRRGDTDFRVVRTRFYPTPPPTTTEDLSIFAQDTWSINSRLTFNFGVRATQQKISGSGGFGLPLSIDPDTGARVPVPQIYTPGEYEFDWEFAPRLGLTWDVNDDGRSKAYINLARYFERIPNDLAIRALSNEVGLTRYRFQDYDYDTGTPSAPRVLDNPADTISFQGLETSTIAPGTKLPFVDELVLGYQREIGDDLSIELRGIYREQGRSLEDVQYNSIESIQNLYYGQDSGYYPAGIDPFPGFESAPFGAYVLANPGENTPSDLPEAVREYKAFEFIASKRFGNNWLMYGNLRISDLNGNYEGLFRNDNGQSDPNITSLFDFPASPLTQGQFDEGVLNTDRPYVMNVYGSYQWDMGLTVGATLRWAAGNPRTPLLAHPIYINSGELPGDSPVYGWWTLDTPGNPLVTPGTTPCGTLQDGSGTDVCWVNGTASVFGSDSNVWSLLPILTDYDNVGRGFTGRNSFTASLDLHLGYQVKTGKRGTFQVAATVFNLLNSTEVQVMNDAVEATAGVLNLDYNRPINILNGYGGYQDPRSVRLMAKWSF